VSVIPARGDFCARSEYLGLHLAIGLLISLAGLWLFAGVTEDVIHHDPLTEVNHSNGSMRTPR
jgi:hypothetical protein